MNKPKKPDVGMLIDRSYYINPDESDWFYVGEIIEVDNTWGHNSFSYKTWDGGIEKLNPEVWFSDNIRIHVDGTRNGY